MNHGLDTLSTPILVRSRFGAPRRWTFAAIGLLLSLGAPLGLLLLRMLELRHPSAAAVVGELRTEWPLYVYVTASTAIALSAFGWVLGRLQDRLREASLSDPLTGIANRRHLAVLLEHELPLALRQGTSLSILLLDVDNLKHINDTGGHAAGDRALLAVARALRAASRRSDIAARTGGDEFAVLAPGADSREAMRVAERIRALLAADPGAPRVSIGVASVPEITVRDAASFLAAADKALYCAKSSGRDRIVEILRRED
jgi:diguanylate cyclase (GGDEF)-like protein